MKIELRTQDLFIKDVQTKEGMREVINLRGSLAFDEDFIQEMKANGVRKFIEEEDTTLEQEA